jgi:hypothetical protein
MGTLREELLALYETRGELTPVMVVDVARDPQHPLHPRFEWDDTVAGEKYRVHQARQLIRSVRIRVIDEDDPGLNYDVRAYQMVRTSSGSHTYQPTEEVVRDPFISRLILANMQRDWQALRQRYEHWHEFWKLVNSDIESRSEGAQKAIDKYGAYIA